MDQAVLVSAGRKLVEWLDQTPMKPRAALWVYNSDYETWKLWIVPANRIAKMEFYLALADIITLHRQDIPGFDIGMVEFKPVDDPVVEGLGSQFNIPGIGDLHLSNNMLNGQLLPDGIVLRMAI
jgi:hypothetical protein